MNVDRLEAEVCRKQNNQAKRYFFLQTRLSSGWAQREQVTVLRKQDSDARRSLGMCVYSRIGPVALELPLMERRRGEPSKEDWFGVCLSAILGQKKL